METIAQPEKATRVATAWQRARAGLPIWRLALAVPSLILLSCAFARRWMTDDGFIDLRIVEHLLLGHGPVFNTGERVEAYTNPLWVALLALWGLAGGQLETGAVVLGLLFGGAGVALAQAAAALLWARAEKVPRGPLLPLGALVFVALPPVWDFTTSGLELGLVFGWLGLCGWLLARLVCQSDGMLVAAPIIGLGPLIRPDLAIFGLLFFGALLYITRQAPYREGAVRAAGLTLAGWGVPVAYQVFRMGYFAAVLPNTLIAKEAGGSRWSQGFLYALDFLQPYFLPLPLLLLAPQGGRLVRSLVGSEDRNGLAVVTAFALGAILHGAAVLRVGGDFMHGRLLLPALFALLLPVAVIAFPVQPASRRVANRAALLAAAVMMWAICCAAFLRVPYAGGVSVLGIADERGVYVSGAGRPNPVSFGDYGAATIARRGVALRERSGDRATLVQNTEHCSAFSDEPQSPACRAILAALPGALPVAEWLAADVRVVALHHVIGVTGYAAGPRVFIVDRLGLADPIASRLQLTTRGRPGHEKWLPNAWYLARFTPPGAGDDQATASAREALACGDLARLHEALTAPLTPTRFVTNMRLAWTFTRLQIPADPVIARAHYCGDAQDPGGVGREGGGTPPGAAPDLRHRAIAVYRTEAL